ncbi:MAG: hypothetical protein FWC61_04975 [Proteobacteria bacterium]|nr:hypothetical protein [Pseudomonadota bacterium]
MNNWHKFYLYLLKARIRFSSDIIPFTFDPFVERVELDETRCDFFERLEKFKHCKKQRTKECPNYNRFKKENGGHGACEGIYFCATVIYENGKRNAHYFPNLNDAQLKSHTLLRNTDRNRKRVEFVGEIRQVNDLDYECGVKFAGDDKVSNSTMSRKRWLRLRSEYLMWHALHKWIQARTKN